MGAATCLGPVWGKGRLSSTKGPCVFEQEAPGRRGIHRGFKGPWLCGVVWPLGHGRWVIPGHSWELDSMALGPCLRDPSPLSLEATGACL